LRQADAVERAKDLIREHGVRFLDLKYPDVIGRLRHVTLPIERLEQVVDEGVGFDSSSITGFRSVEEGDMVLRPDFETAFIDPFAAQPTLSCFAGIFDPATGAEYDRDPRAILRKAASVLRREAGGGELWVRPEFEFYLLNSAKFVNEDIAASYRVETDERSHDDQTGLTLFKGSAYHVAPPFDRSWDFRSELATLLAGVGVPVKYHHHEGGRYSQVEVEPQFLPALAAADGVMLAKYVVRNLALRSGKSATFMPKPIFGEPGSGMHFHQYVGRPGASQFGDEKSPTRLSELALRYIAGILEHSPSLCALTNPSTNSYRRLVPGYEAPTLVFFSFGNRTAAIRIPGYIASPDRMAIEYRIPDGTCNPYLAIAAMALAGADGVSRRLDAGLPFQGGLADATAQFGSKALPRTLSEALAAMKQDCDYLRRDGVFPDGLLEFWDSYRQAESEAVQLRPHPWEFSLYYGS